MENHIIDPTTNIDVHYISTLIKEYDVIPTLRILKSNFGENMNPNISDDTLRCMIWQLSHSLDAIEETSTIVCDAMHMVHNISNANKNTTSRVMARQFVLGVDSLIQYIAV